MTNIYFNERNISDLQDSPESDNEQRQDAPPIKLRIWPEMKYRLYDDFSEDDIEEQPDGSFILTVALPEDNWLYGFILSFGEYAEVLEPGHLRKIIQDKVKNISERYL